MCLYDSVYKITNELPSLSTVPYRTRPLFLFSEIMFSYTLWRHQVIRKNNNAILTLLYGLGTKENASLLFTVLQMSSDYPSNSQRTPTRDRQKSLKPPLPTIYLYGRARIYCLVWSLHSKKFFLFTRTQISPFS